MIAAIIVRLPFLDRPAAIPVLAKLVLKGTNSKSRLWLAARMAHMIADAFPGRETGVVADSAYAGAELKNSRPGSLGPPGCARMPHSASCCPGGPGSPAGPTPRETGSPAWTNSLPQPPGSR